MSFTCQSQEKKGPQWCVFVGPACRCCACGIRDESIGPKIVRIGLQIKFGTMDSFALHAEDVTTFSRFTKFGAATGTGSHSASWAFR